MEKKEAIIERIERSYKRSLKSSIGGTVSINELRAKEERGKLIEEEQLALDRFEKYRVKKLNAASDEDDFHNRYKLFQVLANLSPYEEFLEEKYTIKE